MHPSKNPLFQKTHYLPQVQDFLPEVGMYFGAIPILCLNFSSGFLAPCATIISFVSLEIEQTCTNQSMLQQYFLWKNVLRGNTVLLVQAVVVPLQDSSSMIAGVVPVLATIHNIQQYSTVLVPAPVHHQHHGKNHCNSTLLHALSSSQFPSCTQLFLEKHKETSDNNFKLYL